MQTVDDCVHVLKNRDLRQALYDEAGLMMEHSLVNLHGQEHRARRNVEATVFRKPIFLEYEKEVLPRTLRETLATYLAQGRADLVDLGYRIMMNLTVDFTGIDRPLRAKEESEDLVRITKKLSEGATMVHSTRDPAELTEEVRQALTDLDTRFFRASVERRKAHIEHVANGTAEADELPRDVLTVILRAEDDLKLEEDQQLREIAFYLQAGSHSTANSVVHAVEEILNWAGEDSARWAQLEDPIFVQRCVHESLRLHPASPEAWRRPACPMHVQGAGDVKPDDRVELDLFCANRDPGIFGEDADRFNPEREVPVGVMPSGLAFGIGLHTCLGRELDGGVLAKPGSDPDKRQYGIVPLIVIELLRLGVRRRHSDPPVIDPATSRPNFERYPVAFTKV